MQDIGGGIILNDGYNTVEFLQYGVTLFIVFSVLEIIVRDQL